VPTLPASGYPTPTAPSVEPLPSAGTPFQDIRAPAEAFGGASAAALLNLGTSFEKASNSWEHITNEFDKVSALDARTKADLAANSILYGNPEDTTSTGYFGLEGRAKLEARPNTIKTLRTIYDDAGKGLSPNAKRLYDEATRGHRLGIEANVALDSVKALIEFRREADKGTITLAGQNADRLALTNDIAAWDRSVGEGVQIIQAAGERANLPPETIEANKNTFRANRITEKAGALMERDPAAALEFIDNNSRFYADPSMLEAIRGRAKEKLEARQVDQLASPGGAPRAGATGLVPHTPSTDILTGTGLTADQYQTFRGYLASRESSRYDQPPNAQGYSGRYQMGRTEIRETAERLKVPVPSQQEFLANPELQERFLENYTLDHHNRLMEKSETYRKARPEVKAAFLMGAHLGGVEGVTKYLESSGKIDPADSNGTHISDYIFSMRQALGRSAAPATPTAPSAPSGPVKIVAGGDSIGVGLNQNNALEGTSAGSVTSPEAALADAAGSRNPQQGLDYIKTHPERFAGKNVLWSSGLFNAGGPEKARAALGKVGEQIDALKAAGASNVVLVGLDTGRFAFLNPELERIATEKGVKFAGPLPTDNIHPSPQGYRDYYATASKLFPATTDTQAPTTTQGAPSLASEHARIDASGASQDIKDKAKARVNARYSQQTALWEQHEDTLRRRIRDDVGSVTDQFLDAEMDAGRLGPSQRQQLEAYRHGVVKEREALSDALALVAAAKNDQGVLDPTNEKHRNAVSLDWANTPKVGTAQEQWQQALNYIGKVNIVPGPVKSEITGNLFSGNEGRATAGARQYRDLVALNPMLGEGFNADARAMAATLNTMAGFGMVPKEAFTQAQAQMRVPQAEQEARRKSFDSVRGTSEQDRLTKDTAAITSRHNRLLVNDPDTIPDAMLFDFREAAQTFYARTGNIEAAYQAAYDTVALKWAPSRVGADGLRWTKNAPESLYQAPGRTDSDWMNTQLLADVNAVAPKPFTLDRLHIVPEPEVPGKKPGYYVWYLNDEGHFDYVRDANRVPLTWRPNWTTSSVRAQEAEELRKRHEERARQPQATAPVPPVPQAPLPEDAPFRERLRRVPSRIPELRWPGPSGTQPPPT